MPRHPISDASRHALGFPAWFDACTVSLLGPCCCTRCQVFPCPFSVFLAWRFDSLLYTVPQVRHFSSTPPCCLPRERRSRFSSQLCVKKALAGSPTASAATSAQSTDDKTPGPPDMWCLLLEMMYHYQVGHYMAKSLCPSAHTDSAKRKQGACHATSCSVFSLHTTGALRCRLVGRACAGATLQETCVAHSRREQFPSFLTFLRTRSARSWIPHPHRCGCHDATVSKH